MPRQKGGQVKGEQLKAAQQEKLEKQAIVKSEVALDDLWSNFNESKAYVEELECKLADQAIICTSLRDDFNSSNNLINSLCAEILSLNSRNSSCIWNDNVASVQPRSKVQWHLKSFF